MAISVRKMRGGFALLPTTASGWLAAALLAMSLVLLGARVLLKPVFDLPLNYLEVFAVAAAAGLVALFAVALRHERSATAFVALAAGLVTGAWLLAETIAPGNPHMTLGDSDNGRTLTVAPATVITVMLEGNPTTGYSWESSISDPAVLKQTNVAEFKPSSGAIGAGGTFTFQFQAQSAGKTDVTLLYRRSWETGVAPLKTYHVTVEVR